MVTTNKRQAIILMVMAALAACGGGSGGDSGVNPPPPPPPASRDAQMIAYSAGDGISTNGTTEMYSVADDGSGRALLSAETAPNTAAILDSAISPDGQWVAYIADASGFGEHVLYVTSINGGTPVQVSRPAPTIVGRVSSFQWSPDSMQLVYAGNLGNNRFEDRLASEVFLVNRDGTADTRINGTIGRWAVVEVRNPQWSPDGRYILQEVAVFDPASGGQPNAFALNIYDAMAGMANSLRLVTSQSLIRNARWSPDSTRISYMADQEAQSTYQLYSINVDGTGNARVTDNGDFNSDARWSPDGATLAYLDHPTNPFPSDLVVSAASPGATDSVLVFVSPNDRQVFDYAWSPDGTRLAYTSNEAVENMRELYVINADGSGIATKVNQPLNSNADVFDFAWSPDGSRIAYLSDQDTDTFIDLYVGSSAGGDVSQVSTGLSGEEVVEFAWSDDSRRIAFSTGPEGRTPQSNKLYVSEPNGNGRIEISAAMTSGPLRFEYD